MSWTGHRDLYTAWSDDGSHFKSVAKQGLGTWKLNACPMDGGGFVVGQAGVTSAWRRENEIYLAEPGKPEVRLGPGKDVAVAQSKRGTYVAWTKDSGIVARAPGSGDLLTLTPAGGFVTLVPLPDGGVLAAWESDGFIDTKRLD